MPPLILIHGVGSSGAGWPPCPTLPPLRSVALYTEAIRNIVLTVGDNAVVVAHSMGAYLTLQTALRFPALIGKLVLMSMPGYLPWLGAHGALWASYFRAAGSVPWRRIAYGSTAGAGAPSPYHISAPQPPVQNVVRARAGRGGPEL